ncbi:MAG: P1 family peptidase [Gemmatimonadales bacterium]|jgi:L-aminopeptidase/D-esterase-like protein
MLRFICSLSLGLLVVTPHVAIAQSVRARDLGIPFDGEPGPLNAITDVAGVEVGHVTLVEGEGALQVGRGPIRTGVTAILPRGRDVVPVFAGWYSLNGNGEMTGTTWVEESGFLEGPVMITNTHSVGVVHDAVIEWMRDRRAYDRLGRRVWWSLPVVAETWDGTLNDINGFHVRKEHAFQALERAGPGPVPEGNVGGGTGMICHRFKGGIGTSSRRVGSYTIGVLVQCNYGGRRGLRIAGVPVGEEITDLMPEYGGAGGDGESGSIIVVVATDAPLLPHQLKRLARRVPMGIGRVGGIASNGSGDIFIAFSTANREGWHEGEATMVEMLPNARMTPLFEATVAAVEEAIVNAMVAARTMEGINGNRVYALPHDRLQAILERYRRLGR